MTDTKPTMVGQLAFKSAVVTGGTDGVGKEIARGLACKGVRLIIIGSDPVKGSRAECEIKGKTGNAEVRYIQADLSLVSETNRLADEVAAHWPALHYLVHSAGIVRGRQTLTAEGIESNFAINYLSRFTLTQRLLPLLEAAGRPGETARIVNIGGAAQNGKIHYDDVNLTANFNTVRAVMQFCQANDVFTVEQARRIGIHEKQTRVTIINLKLGVVKTNIRSEFPLWMKLLVSLVFDPLLGQTPQEAADVALGLLLNQEFEGVTGCLFLKIKRFKQVSPGTHTLDQTQGRRLWKLSESLTRKALTQ